jgi:hypothetical protein
MEDPSVKARLILAAAFILVLPALFAPPTQVRQHNAIPFVSIAEAGRTVAGVWCEPCDDTVGDCICEAGENPGMHQDSNNTNGPSGKDQEPAPDSSSAPGALFFGLLVILLWLKMR